MRRLSIAIVAAVFLLSCSKQPKIEVKRKNRLISSSIIGGYFRLYDGSMQPIKTGLTRAKTDVWNRLLSLSPGTGRYDMSGSSVGTSDASLFRYGRIGTLIPGNSDANAAGLSGARAASANFLKSFHEKYGHLLASVPPTGSSSSGGRSSTSGGVGGWVWRDGTWMKKGSSSEAGGGSGKGSSERSSSSCCGTGASSGDGSGNVNGGCTCCWSENGWEDGSGQGDGSGNGLAQGNASGNGNGQGDGSGNGEGDGTSPESGTGSGANGIASFSCDPGSMLHLLAQDGSFPFGLCMLNSPFAPRLGNINDIQL
ncbi:MAG: hypothetical protein WCS85_03250 [Candidatus Peribacteraceae bacterium]|jgi:hypothetical protein